MYDNGEGVPQDSSEAAKWYRKAAEQGFINAQSALGYLYKNGRGVRQDYVAASTWYRKAADHGDYIAQIDLGCTARRPSISAKRFSGPPCIIALPSSMHAAIGEFVATIRPADSFVSDYTAQTAFFGWPDLGESVIGEMHLLRGRMHS
jgi:TPR repeat protein